MKKKNKLKRDRHHIIPTSRGGDDSSDNIIKVLRYEHDNYHTLFGNRTPPEITEYLVRNFWNDNWDFVREAYERYYKKI